ncbi:MAG TPA: CRISPR-associated endonuclease Cas2 [Lentisphaeria bacterium]|nr:CRISPR-associated endonuclease Cas2 [Lentisphaeria bacterium]
MYNEDENWPQPVEWFNRYYPAAAAEESPADKECKNMLRIVAYDICDPKRLRKVAKICELYGIRIEKSVFECDLKQEMFEQLWLELIDVIDEDEDCVIAYKICKSCIQDAELLGKITRPRKIICYFIG